MMLSDIKSIIPSYAKDIKLNLTSLFTNKTASGLSDEQFTGIALSVAYATKNKTVIKLVEAETDASIEVIEGAKLAASLMAMNNVYYRFVHLVSDDAFNTLKAGLRMNGIANPGIPAVDFELNSLAVSAINGCGLCIDSHVKALQRQSVGNEIIQQSIKIAAVLESLSQVLAIEEKS